MCPDSAGGVKFDLISKKNYRLPPDFILTIGALIYIVMSLFQEHNFKIALKRDKH